MSNGETKHLDGLLEYLKKNKLSTTDAETMLKGHNAKVAQEAREKAMADFRRGLWFRNLLALFLLVALFMAFLQQTSLPY